MSIGTQFALFAMAAAASLSLSWLLVTRLERLGQRLGLSEALLGLIAALAADTPEITSSVTALLHGQRDVGAGVVIGSNVFNLAALLGLGAIVAGSFVLHRRVVVLGGAVAIWVAVVTVTAMSGWVSAPVALGATLIILVPYVVVLGAHRRGLRGFGLPERWRRWLESAIEEEESELDAALDRHRGTGADLVVAVVALVIVLLASILMEQTATRIGAHYSVPGLVIGGIVLAAVTSLPNAVAAVYLAAKGRGAATLSTALNSNSLNVVAGLLIPAVLLGLSHPSGASTAVGTSYLALTVVALGFAYLQRGLRRSAGVVIVLCYLVFVAALLAAT